MIMSLCNRNTFRFSVRLILSTPTFALKREEHAISELGLKVSKSIYSPSQTSLIIIPEFKIQLIFSRLDLLVSGKSFLIHLSSLFNIWVRGMKP